MLGSQALSRGTFQKFQAGGCCAGLSGSLPGGGHGAEHWGGAEAWAVVEGWLVPTLETSAARPGVWILSHTPEEVWGDAGKVVVEWKGLGRGQGHGRS